MIRLKRRNTPWLLVLGIIVGFAFLTGAVPPLIQAALLVGFGAAMIGSMFEFGKEKNVIKDVIQRAPLRNRITPQAKEAVERAKSRTGFAPVTAGMTMLDVGVIALQTSSDGIAMRRTRNMSKDDDGVRPFVTLHVQPEEAGRNSVIRFEFINHYGEQAFVHEMRTYLRDGEMNVMADHHLPLSDNDNVSGTGDWDLRVYIDGELVALHNVMLAPSVRERQRRLSGSRERLSDYVEKEEVVEEIPMSLHELLQEKQRSVNSNRRS